jgi:hypothetical protein
LRLRLPFPRLRQLELETALSERPSLGDQGAQIPLARIKQFVGEQVEAVVWIVDRPGRDELGSGRVAAGRARAPGARAEAR